MPATHCCARISRAPATLKSPRRSRMASESSFIHYRKRPIRQRRGSSTRSTCCSTAPSLTTCGSSRRWTASCKESLGTRRDKVMIEQLKTIGIEKGKPFNPDAKTQKILSDAVREAHAWMDLKYEATSQRRSMIADRMGLARRSRRARRLQDEFRRSQRLPGGRPRRRHIRWRYLAPSIWGRGSSI